MPKRSIPKGGTRGTVYKAAARERILDAEKLYDTKRVHGAIYLAGYAIECHLKYAVCESVGSTYLDSSLETHSWDTLLRRAGLKPKLQQNGQIQSVYDDLAEVWTTALRYNPASRVLPGDLALYHEFMRLYDFLRETVP
jgi:hypothetical protein